MMATLEETLAAVQAEKTADDSLIALFDGLKAQLADVLSGTVIPPPVQAKIDAIFSQASENVTEVNAAIAANTPAAPAP
jgi:hypothetical protein